MHVKLAKSFFPWPPTACDVAIGNIPRGESRVGTSIDSRLPGCIIGLPVSGRLRVSSSSSLCSLRKEEKDRSRDWKEFEFGRPCLDPCMDVLEPRMEGLDPWNEILEPGIETFEP